MSMLQVYWLIKLDAISSIFAWSGAACIVVLFVVVCCIGMSLENFGSVGVKARGIYKKVFFVIAPATFLSLVVSAMIPSTKEMCAIIVIPKVINAASRSEALKQVPELVLNTANAWIKDMTPGNIKDGVKEIVEEIKK